MVDEYRLMDCFECGACSFVCPAHIPLVQRFRVAKAAVRRAAALERAAASEKGTETERAKGAVA
jgi:electron transport complex protein RnfC